MLHELVCHHFKKNERRYLFLTNASYRVGKALDNDIVLLDADVPPYLATLEKKNSSYLWQEQEKTIDLHKNQFETHGYRFQIQNYHRSLMGVTFGMIFWISLLFFQWFYGGPDLVLQGTNTLPARGTYGNIEGKAPVSSLWFEFQSGSGKNIILHYTPGNLGNAEDLEIRINEKFLAFVPPSPGKWNVEMSQYIPQGLLSETINKLEFKFHGQKTKHWAIRDVHVETTDEVPVAQNENDFLKTAEKFLRERGVRKGNLVRAQQELEKATQFYQSKNREPSIFFKALSERVRKEKLQMIQDHQMLAQKFRREGESQKAVKVFQKLMAELVDPMDPDRIVVESESQSQK